jgi:sensor histidine kinase YesM
MVSAIFTAAILTLSSLLLVMFSGQMRGRLILDKLEFTANVADNINDTFANLIKPVVLLSINTYTRRLLQDRVPRYSPEWLTNIRTTETYLDNAVLFNPEIIDVVIIKADSAVAYSYSSILDRDYDYYGAWWFQEARRKPGLLKYASPHGDDHYYKQFRGRPYTVSIIFPVQRADILLGHILYEVDIARMSRIFINRNGKDEGFIMMESGGNVIFDYRQQRDPEELREISSYLASYNGSAYVLNGNLYTCWRLDSTGWFILSETNIRILTDPLRRIAAVSTAVLTAAMILIVILVTRVLKQVRIPMNRLLERIARYDGTGAVPLEKTDDQYSEIFTIHSKFEEMADKINSLIGNIYEEQNRRREIEFAALANQINPHFLYNILQTIQGEAVLADNRVIENMVTDLAEMLRYSMDRGGEEAPLSEELAYTDSYLRFYKARFPDLFDYEIRRDKILDSFRVPKLSLQPLVENCFKHGFCNRKTGGRIMISAEQKPSALSIEIWDNGQGIPAARLSAILKKMEMPDGSPGIGLANTHTRIRLKYGAGYGILIESEEGAFTRIILLMPVCFAGGRNV